MGKLKRQPGGQRGKTRIYVLSDSTGNLARHMLTAFLTQFPPGAFAMVWRPFLQSEEGLTRALAEVWRKPGMVFHAVIGHGMKRRIAEECAAHGVPACDLTGQFVAFIEQHTGLKASEDYSRLHRVDEGYHRRIRAMEFTLEHDDGLGLDTLSKADIVLTGVSRTSKTPTSIYLAQQGYKVANVSLAIEVEVPPALLKAPNGKVVGLLISPAKLVEVRTRRSTAWRLGDTVYNDPDHVREEITWSRRLFAKQGWPTIDVTDYAIEETAARVVEALGLGATGERKERSDR